MRHCPVHGAGYTHCLGCLTEAWKAQQQIELGQVNLKGRGAQQVLWRLEQAAKAAA